MKASKLLFVLFTLTLALFSKVAAQEELKVYLSDTDPIIAELQGNIRGFLDEVQPLKDKNDVVGLKSTADKYVGIWNGMLEQLRAVETPEQASRHREALEQLMLQQRESSQIMSDTLANRIEVILEIQKMKSEEVPQEEIEAFIQSNRLNKEELLEKTNAVKQATVEADQTLKAERKQLLELVGNNS